MLGQQAVLDHSAHYLYLLLHLIHFIFTFEGLYRKMEIYRPHKATMEEMTKYHSDDYIRFLRSIRPDNMSEYNKQVRSEIQSPHCGLEQTRRDVSTGPLNRPFARSLAPLTLSLAPDCSLRSRSAALTCSLARSLRSLPRSWESEFFYVSK